MRVNEVLSFKMPKTSRGDFYFHLGLFFFWNNMLQPSPSNKIKHFTQNQLNVVERSSSSESSSQAAKDLNSQVGKGKPGNDISTVRPIIARLKPRRSQWRKHVCLIWWKKPAVESGGQTRLGGMEPSLSWDENPLKKERKNILRWTW